ncbi:hypothetical protein A9Q84_04460 [Halobacteriovorax marinus]|uniref:Lipoprotein n=1 Tax=Halobacteriovorax marinus TaxID=97084 RepID=A0A1Y5FG41_9BACT|nr:hypothetical protein A9Q84_04460 [Halobacteriovorax marinus]
MKLSKNIKLLSLLGMTVLSTNAFSAFSSSTVELNLHDECGTSKICEIEEYGVTIECSGNVQRGTGYGLSCSDGDFTISTTKFPMVGLKTHYYPLKVNGNTVTNVKQNHIDRDFTKELDFTNSIVFKDAHDQPYLKSIFVQKSIHNAIYNVASALNAPLFESYRFVNLQLEKFKKNIKKSDIGHTARLQKALEEGMKLLDAKDKKTGESLYSILDWRIQENSRLIIAFGSILDELLAEYDHVESIKFAIENMRILVSELRKSYGWNRGLSGNVSKASSTLLEVIRLEVQELGAIKMSLGETTTAFSDILKITGQLKAKIDAAKSGDMRAQRDIWRFLDVWNDEAWQVELNKLVDAGPDVKGLVTPKLSMLIQAMESIEELTDAGFIIPEL